MDKNDLMIAWVECDCSHTWPVDCLVPGPIKWSYVTRFHFDHLDGMRSRNMSVLIAGIVNHPFAIGRDRLTAIKHVAILAERKLPQTVHLSRHFRTNGLGTRLGIRHDERFAPLRCVVCRSRCFNGFCIQLGGPID